MASLGSEQGQGHVLFRYGNFEASVAAPERKRPVLAETLLPKWAREAAPPEAKPPRPLAPSALAADDHIALAPSEAMRTAALRGTWIHQLLERLPSLVPEKREAAARSWLERSAGVEDEAMRCEIAGTVCGILSDPRFSDLFGPDSLAEAPLAATLADGRVIAGTVDRLRVEGELVSVIDFKTGRVPADAASIPKAHRAQMEAYAQALEIIFPGREVRAALLYTAGPQLFELAS
jgi:ATP-dependent helicase/nuclease subunit A